VRTGWHYTPAGNLPSIQERGLVPCSLREDLRDVIAGSAEDEIAGRTGIFVWERRQSGREHFGTATAVTMRHHAATVAVLQVEWPDEHTAKTDRPLTHDGYIDDIEYHRDEPFAIVTRTIVPERIRVVDLVPGAAALGYLLGASGVLGEWQAERIARGLGPGPGHPKVSRNAPCLCGSGRKAKRCCAN
jgi:hypothetical protein